MANLTQRDFINKALELITDEDYIAKGHAMLDALDKKKGSSKGKVDKGTRVNALVKDAIVEVLGASEVALSIPALIPLLPTEVTLEDEVLGQTYSSQRVSGLLTQLRKDGLVKRVMDKKTATFTLGNENEDAE